MAPYRPPLFETEKIGDIYVVKILTEEITYRNQKALLEETRETFEEEGDRFLIDLSGVQLMDSVSLGLLSSFKRHMDAKGASIRLCGLEPHIYEIFKILKFHEIFVIYKTRDEALAASWDEPVEGAQGE